MSDTEMDRGAGGFVGRGAELAVMREQLELVRRGQFRLVLIEGEPGIGKTRLVRHFLGEIAADVVEATGDEAESDFAYGVVEQLVKNVAELPPLLAGLPADRSCDPLAVGAELVNVVGALEREAPLVVLVDDAQWADAASMQALTFAVRRLDVDPILALVVARNDDRLPEGLRRIVTGERGTRVRLQGLDSEELAHLAAAVGVPGLPRRAAERLARHTDGHPLHARTLIEELGADGLVGSIDASLPAPRSYAVLVLARLATCSDDARSLVTATSVLGDTTSLGDAARVAANSAPLDALEEAVSAGLLEVDQARLVRFPHPLLRAAVYHDLGAGRRAELHRRAAELGGTAALDHRLAAAGADDDELSADLEADGHRLVTKGLRGAAARRFESAARISTHPARRDALVLDALEVGLESGDLAAVGSLANEVLGLAESTQRSYALGLLALLRGEVPDAEALLNAAWDRARQHGESRYAALASGLLAQLASLDDRFDVGIEWAERCLGTGVERHLTADALASWVGVLGATGRADTALAAVADIDPDGPLDARALAGLQARGCTRLWTDDLRGARHDLSAVVRESRRQPVSRASMIALGYLAEAEFRLGAWDDSVSHSSLAMSLTRDSGQVWLDGFVHAHAVWVLAARGDWATAHEHARAAQSLGMRWALGCIGAASAHLAFCQQQHEAVVTAVQPLISHPVREGLDEPGVHRWREVYVDALISLDRLEEAEAVLAPFEKLATLRRRRSCLASIACARGRIAARRGDKRKARSHFLAAVEHAESVPAPFELALAQEAFGRHLRRDGARRDAADQLCAAHAAYVRLGATPFVERADKELAGCGLAPTKRHAIDRTRLTPQEQSVAHLVASGRTNRETASELIVSVKTVEYHLGNIYSKLGIRSRTELVGRLDADHLTPTPGRDD
jgi:DNA-binding CsgD family transcriptional regulator